MTVPHRALRDKRSLPALTSLRFFAALAVVVSHLSERGIVPPLDGLVYFFDGGRTAVAFFFVLSGFVLTYNYRAFSGWRGIREFYLARIARIYPTVLFAFVLAAIGVAYAYAHRAEGLLFSWYSLDDHVEIFLGASGVAQLLTATGWLPSASLNQPWNGPAWSITCEMFFYALFPALVVFLRRGRLARLLSALSIVFALQLTWIFVVAPLFPPNQAGFLVSQFPLPHLPEFVAGVAAGISFERGGREWLEGGVRREAFIGTGVFAFIALSQFHPVNPAYLVMTPAFVLLVLGFAVAPRGSRSSWLAFGPLVLLGEASFALYLIHTPLINIYLIPDLPQQLGWGFMAVVLGISIALFRFYETPARRLLRDRFTRPPQYGQ